jgi:hypothetical protein
MNFAHADAGPSRSLAIDGVAGGAQHDAIVSWFAKRLKSHLLQMANMRTARSGRSLRSAHA